MEEHSQPVDTGATDISVGYAADSFIGAQSDPEVRDPWAEAAFVTLFDAVTNHRTTVFPHPTKVSSLRPDRLPKLFAAFVDDSTGVSLLSPFVGEFPVHDPGSKAHLEVVLREFFNLVITRQEAVSQWIVFQESLRDRHLVGLPEEVQPHTAAFWSTLTTSDIPAFVSISDSRLRYAFDVFLRGDLYLQILSRANANYFPHHFRVPIYALEPNSQKKTKIAWSWGGIIASLLRKGRLPSDPQSIAALAVEIRRHVLQNKATFYDAKSAEEMKGVAAELGLPARIQADLIDAFARVAKYAATINADIALHTYGGITLLTELLGVQARTRERYVPGSLGRISVMRSHLEWPGWNWYDA